MNTKNLNSSFCMCTSSCHQTIFWKNYLFSMTCIAMFVKNLSAINGLSIFSHWFFLPILAPVLNLIDLLLLCYAQSCLTFFDPINCCPPGSSVHGISCARILEWVAISYSRRTFLTSDQICISCVSCIGRWILYHSATGKPLTDYFGIILSFETR